MTPPVKEVGSTTPNHATWGRVKTVAKVVGVALTVIAAVALLGAAAAFLAPLGISHRRCPGCPLRRGGSSTSLAGYAFVIAEEENNASPAILSDTSSPQKEPPAAPPQDRDRASSRSHPSPLPEVPYRTTYYYLEGNGQALDALAQKICSQTPATHTVATARPLAPVLPACCTEGPQQYMGLRIERWPKHRWDALIPRTAYLSNETTEGAIGHKIVENDVTISYSASLVH